MDLLRIHSKLIATALLSLSFSLSAPAQAQDAPSGRIARVSYSYGNISFSDAGNKEWLPLLANRPISSGDGLFTPDAGRAELQVGANALRLHERTRISFLQLTDNATQIQLSQGRMVFRVRALFDGESFEVRTPNLNFSIQEPGEYRINVNEDNTSTIIVRRGVGVAQGERDIITLRGGEQARFSGTNLNYPQITQVPPFDTFDQWAVDRDRIEENSVSARYVPRDIVGYQQLDEYGNWERHSDHGAIWYPRSISTGWAPYRDGQWVWVAPWGWTWVDRSPWGFAPYHYGRWAFVGKRWGWVPGRYERHHRAIYAPALVAFIGHGSHGTRVSIGVNSSRHSPFHASVAWFPLGPGEIYRPSYAHNDHYMQHLNQNTYHGYEHGSHHHRDRTNHYRNHHIANAVTSVSTQTFVRGDHVFPASQSILSAQVKKMQLATEAPTLTPDKGNRFGEGRSNWQLQNQRPDRSEATQQTALPLTSTRSDLGKRTEMNDGRADRFERNNSNIENRSNGILGNIIKTPANTIHSNGGTANQTNSTQTTLENTSFPLRGRQDDHSNRPNMNNSRMEIQEEKMNQNNAVPTTNTWVNNSAQQFPKTMEQKNGRSNEGAAERNVDRNTERQHERNVERFARPTERSGDPSFERTRPVEREVSQTPRMEPRVEPRSEPRAESRASIPEFRREAPSRVESKPESTQEYKPEKKHEKEGEKRRFER